MYIFIALSMTKNVTFCFDFGSPYSYLAYNNLNSIREAGGEVTIMPVLLGGIFKATGNQPPATVQKKGEYMFKDINRWSQKLDIPFKMNPYFPILTVPHMRGAVLAQRENILEKYMQVMFEAIWVKAMNLNDQEILKRAVSVTENYDRFSEMAQDYTVKGKGDIDELKKQLYLAMVNVNLLEGLRFYVSFACTFAFGELKLMEGSAKILSLIARDEATHLNLSTHVIKAWQKGDDKGMSKVIKGLDKTVIEMFKKCVEEEKAWAKHLFKDGSIIGLNERLLGTYVEWIANKRLRALGFDPLYDVGASQNPLPWTQHWLSSKGLQVAPQETEVESYLIGGIKQDVKKGQFSKFKL